jgi:hypothetical protein
MPIKAEEEAKKTAPAVPLAPFVAFKNVFELPLPSAITL